MMPKELPDEELERLKDNAEEYVLAWRSLVDTGWQHAAAGLLCDLFGFLRETDIMCRVRPSSPSEDLASSRWDAARAAHREAAMEILEHDSGDQLKRLLTMHKDDPPAFEKWATKFARTAVHGPLPE